MVPAQGPSMALRAKKLNYYTVSEIAETLQLNPLTIYSYIQSGQLLAVKLGRYYRIAETDFKVFISKHRTRRQA